MRRRLATVSAAGILAAAAPRAAACGTGGPPVKVSGAFGRQPDVAFPGSKPRTDLSVSTPIEGRGAKVARGDVVVANYIDYRWGKGGDKLIASSYAGGAHPKAFPTGKLLPG